MTTTTFSVRVGRSTKSPQKKSGDYWLVEYHHFGDEGLDVSDVRQTATCGERAKVLVGVALIIGLVIILRKELQNSFIIWLIAALERIHEDQTPARLQHPGTFAKNDAAHLRR